jgi:hypothetical protein
MSSAARSSVSHAPCWSWAGRLGPGKAESVEPWRQSWDEPPVFASAVLVTSSGVSVHMSGGDRVTLPFAPASTTRTCDLKKLDGPQDVLGTGPLAAGHYTQIRLMVDSAAIYSGGATVAGPACATTATTLLPTPSGGLEVLPSPVVVPSWEIKLNREFDVPAGVATMIVLDLDGDKSINQTGNGKYMMKPVVSVVSVQESPLDRARSFGQQDEAKERRAHATRGQGAPLGCGRNLVL